MDIRYRFILRELVISAMLLLTACSAAGEVSGEPTPSPAITAVPSQAALTSTATAPASMSPAAPVTLADDGHTITLIVGQTILLNLGEGYTWGVSVDEPSLLSREVNILVIKGAQGIYRADAPGTANLSATGDPLCRQSTPPCMAPSREFHIRIVINTN